MASILLTLVLTQKFCFDVSKLELSSLLLSRLHPSVSVISQCHWCTSVFKKFHKHSLNFFEIRNWIKSVFPFELFSILPEGNRLIWLLFHSSRPSLSLRDTMFDIPISPSRPMELCKMRNWNYFAQIAHSGGGGVNQMISYLNSKAKCQT